MYGVMQHKKGRDTDEDHLVMNRKTCKPYKYLYEASAKTLCEMLQSAHRDRYKFWVVRLD